MPQIIDVPGQGQVEFPDGMDDAAIVAAIQGMSAPQPQAPKSDIKQDIRQGLGNLAAGALRGAGSIGATIVAPGDMINDALMGRGLSLQSNRERRAAIDEGLSQMGADPSSMLYQGGKIAGEIAGTAGVPGALAKGAQAAKATPAIVNALRTGGFAAQSIPGKIAAGAVTGGATAGLVNPEDAGMGAAVGGALPATVSALRGGAKLAGKFLGGTTGVGDEALSQAYRAGKEGGQVGKSFTEAMRGQSSMDDVLTAAKQNLDVMGQQKQAAYRSGMANIKADKSVLDFGDIDQALNNATDKFTYKGRITNPDAAKVTRDMYAAIDEWKKLNPAEYHTPEGFDALKKALSGIQESIPFEQKQARMAAGEIYNAVKSTISKQAPEYSKVMKDYSQSSDLINEIQKALIGGNKATAESSMRKLQSLMRNNVNTSYGYRQNLAQQLEQAGGQELMPALAGQALQEWTPRGIQRAAAGTGSAGLAVTGNIPAAAGLAAVSSPRLVGEALYGAGRMRGAVPQSLVDALRQGAVTGAPVVSAQ